MSSNRDIDWQQIHREAMVIDVHAHPSIKISLWNRILTARLRADRSFDPFGICTDFPKLKKGGVDLLLATAYAPERGILQECPYIKALKYLMPRKWQQVYGRPYFEVTMQMLDVMESAVHNAVDADGAALATMITSVTALEAYLQQGADRPIGIIHNIEGAHCLEGKLDQLEKFYQRGVAYLTIAHFYANEAAHPCFPYPESVQKAGCFKGDRNLALGLTPFGEEVIEKMIELGMIVDVAHCTPIARRRIYAIVGKRAPIIASHVGAYAVNPDPYNLRDEEIKRISDSGGVTAVIFMNDWLMPQPTKRGLNFISRTLEHFIRAGGIEHVAIGTDFDGFTDTPDDVPDAAELPRLTQRLISDGYSVPHIRKLWGENALRVLLQGWKKRE